MAIKTHRVLFTLTASWTFALAATAGDIVPPAGPVSPTLKTLEQVEPRIPIGATTTPGDANSQFRIDSPGSYYLTGNLTGESAKRCIEIASSDVTLDLMGFTLQGVAGSLQGIATQDGAHDNLSVTNGIVREWGGAGIDLRLAGDGTSSLIDSIQSLGNGSMGVRTNLSAVVTNSVSRLNVGPGFIIGANSISEKCIAESNGGAGFSTGDGIEMHDCVAASNTLDGFSMSIGSSIFDCTAIGNGEDGIDVSKSSTVTNCTSSGNGANGIEAVANCQIRFSTCDGNTLAGIRLGSLDARVDGNSVTDNAIGIDVDATGNLIVRNSASGNTTANYDIIANNKVGVIVTAPNSGAILGASGGAGVGTTDPWANLSY